MKLFRIWLAYKRLALPSVLVSVWDLAVSFSAYSSNLFPPLILEGREEGVGAYFFSFFLQTTQRMQLSWLQVCLFCWQVMQYCSDNAAIRMHCETTGVWLKVVCPNAWSSDCWNENPAEWQRLSVEEVSAALSIRVCDWSQVPFAVH